MNDQQMENKACWNKDYVKRKIMISGMGIQCAGSHSIHDFTHVLREGRASFCLIPDEQVAPAKINIAAILQNFSLKEQLVLLDKLPSSLLTKTLHCAQRAPLPIQTSIIAALQAWQQARLHDVPIPSDRIGIVVACDNASQRYHYDMQNKFLDGPDYLSPRYAMHALETDHVGILSELLTVHGEGFTVGGASASGNVAILKASQLIQLGLIDVCVVVGALSELSPIALQSYYNAGALGGHYFKNKPEESCRPFDNAHEGFIYGQGCGCLILEAADSIKIRRVDALSELLSAVLLLDGNSLPNPNKDGEARVMTACIKQAGIQPEHVDYINAHGSSSPLGDITEIKAIKQVFQEQAGKIWINSTKGLVGHCLFSAGIIEAIACVIQIQHDFIHPNINLINPVDNTCRFAPNTVSDANVNIAMSNSFGFGGINSSILLKKCVKNEVIC